VSLLESPFAGANATPPPLWAIAGANLLLFLALARPDLLEQGGLSLWLDGVIGLLPFTLALTFLAVVLAQSDMETKAAVVSMDFQHPEPGCRAFSPYAPLDPRIDMGKLEARIGPLPRDPDGQIRKWYELFLKLEGDAGVQESQREWVSSRDFCFLALMLLVCLAPAGLFIFRDIGPWALYAIFMGAQFVLARNTALANGRRFVCTVLARTAAG
jgi:hypothetical protein